MDSVLDGIARDGYAVLEGLFGPVELDSMDAATGRFDAEAKEKGGGRNLFRKDRRLLDLFRGEAVMAAVRRVLGSRIGISEGLYLDKREDANWLVAWHQDLFISVKRKADAEGFHSWTEKQGAPYVQPPARVLGECLRFRFRERWKEESPTRRRP